MTRARPTTTAVDHAARGRRGVKPQDAPPRNFPPPEASQPTPPCRGMVRRRGLTDGSCATHETADRCSGYSISTSPAQRPSSIFALGRPLMRRRLRRTRSRSVLQSSRWAPGTGHPSTFNGPEGRVFQLLPLHVAARLAQDATRCSSGEEAPDGPPPAVRTSRAVTRGYPARSSMSQTSGHGSRCSRAASLRATARSRRPCSSAPSAQRSRASRVEHGVEFVHR